jgi:hypothetical protein
MRNEIHFIGPGVRDDTKLSLLGPFEEDDGPFVDILPGWSMAHIMHSAGVFPSVKQAKSNGWDKPIPEGYSEFTVGKRKLKIYIVTSLNTLDAMGVLYDLPRIANEDDDSFKERLLVLIRGKPKSREQALIDLNKFFNQGR